MYIALRASFSHSLVHDFCTTDMTGHVKSSLMGPSLNVPIKDGRLALVRTFWTCFCKAFFRFLF